MNINISKSAEPIWPFISSIVALIWIMIVCMAGARSVRRFSGFIGANRSKSGDFGRFVCKTLLVS